MTKKFRAPRKKLRPLPVAGSGFGRHILWMMTAMIFVALCVSLICLTFAQLGYEWRGRLMGRYTVVVPARVAVDDAERRGLIDGAEAALRAVEGVTDVYAPSRQELLKMLFPWLNEETVTGAEADFDPPVPSRLELPLLIDVETAGEVDVGALEAALAKVVAEARIDDHGIWRNRLLKAAGLIMWGGIAVFCLLTLVAGGLVLVAVRAMFETHARSLHLLHVMGADDVWLARIFRDLAYSFVSRAGLIAAAIYLVLAFAAARFLDLDFSADQISRAALTVSISVPVFILALTVIAGQAARFEILRRIKRWP